LTFAAKLEPSVEVGLLAQMTEVMIRPRQRKEADPSLPFKSDESSNSNLFKVLGLTGNRATFRVAPIPETLQKPDRLSLCIESDTADNVSDMFVRLKSLPRLPEDDVNGVERTFKCRMVNTRLQSPAVSFIRPAVYMSRELMSSLKLDLGAVVEIGIVARKAESGDYDNRVILFKPKECLEKDAIRAISENCCSYPIVVPNDILVRIGGSPFSVYNPSSSRTVVINSEEELLAAAEWKETARNSEAEGSEKKLQE
jgi:hypothetical protein